MFLILTILQRWKKFMSFFLVSEFFPTSQNTFRNKFEAFVSKQVKPRIWSWTKATLPATDGFDKYLWNKAVTCCSRVLPSWGMLVVWQPHSHFHRNTIHDQDEFTIYYLQKKHPESKHLVSGLPSRSLLRVFKTATTFYLWNRSN